MIAETTEQICTDCWRSKPLDQFRYRNKATGERHSVCRDCRRARDQASREKDRERIFSDALRQVRRASTPQQILSILESIASQLGGIEAVAEEWARHLRGDGVSVSRKLKAMETLIFAGSVADLARIQEALSGADGPSNVAGLMQHFAEVDRPALIAALRQMLDEGKLTLDDLDPPPSQQEPT